MRVKTPEAAVDELVDRLRLPLSCVTSRPLLATRHRVASGRQYVSFLPINEPASLRLTSGGRIAYSFRCDYEVVLTQGSPDRFEARVTGYWHEVVDAGGHELIGFHWHPVGASSVTSPHLHLSSRIGPISIDDGDTLFFGEMHLPTGFVSLAEIVRLLIVEFSVEPRRGDWEAVLEGQ